MNRRVVGRTVAAVAAVASFAWAGWAAHDNAMPEFRIYDGYRMMLGATLAVIAVVPFIWRWRNSPAPTSSAQLWWSALFVSGWRFEHGPRSEPAPPVGPGSSIFIGCRRHWA